VAKDKLSSSGSESQTDQEPANMKYLAKFCLAYLDSCEPNEDILKIVSMRLLPAPVSEDLAVDHNKVAEKEFNILFSTTKGKLYVLKYSKDFVFKSIKLLKSKMAFKNIKFYEVHHPPKPNHEVGVVEQTGIQLKYIKALNTIVFVKGAKLEFYKFDFRTIEAKPEEFDHPYLSFTIPELE
jgi:hypothetical protein